MKLAKQHNHPHYESYTHEQSDIVSQTINNMYKNISENIKLFNLYLDNVRSAGCRCDSGLYTPRVCRRDGARSSLLSQSDCWQSGCFTHLPQADSM